MRDPRLDELIQMETWDWWKAQVFYLRVHMNKVILPIACMTTCSPPPNIPMELANATPSVM